MKAVRTAAAAAAVRASALIKHASDLPDRDNYVATYYREIEVPKDWKGMRAYLNLQAKSAYYIWVNQEYVGYSEDSRDVSEFDLTEHLRYGKSNSIVVQVVSVSDGSLLESNYERTINGITADPYIVLKPAVNVMDYQITADYDSPSQMGTFKVNLDIFNATRKGQYYVEVELWDPRGRQVEKMGRWMVFDKKNELEMELERSIAGVKAWSDETPNLYTMVVRLRDQKMNLVETVGSRFGFRTVALADGLLTVNGMPVVLRGTLYHFYDVASGTFPTEEKVRQDLKLMKQHNINAIRTTLYSPCAPYLYELCDEYGIYVIPDANLQP